MTARDAGAAMTNALAGETSPYLLQHKDNPVHWQPWGPAALAAAQAQDKPILLSIGYAACHWCHVMAHECFEDAAVAALMNHGFVTIKVDREERPDLDTIYQHALAAMGEQGGWPLTMFLTPAGEPFWGGTYFPPTARWGRPGFPDVLNAIGAAYRDKRDQIAQNVTAIKQSLARLGRPEGGAGIDIDFVDRAALRLAQEVDTIEGGIGSAPKFPQVPVFALLWRGALRLDNAALRQAVLVTLDRISQGGIYDHLGGGFARYSVDQHWLVPHFEKMLYDNALLVELLTSAWQATRSPLYAARVEETIGWAVREMLLPEGGFASSLDADSEHEEGKFYVWTEAEIDRRLGTGAARFKEIYDVRPDGNWEGHTILNRLHHIALGTPAAEAELTRCRAVLFEARAPRVRPGRDDKVLADWNGLMIAALAASGTAFARPDWVALAERGFRFIRDALGEGDGRLAHAWRAGKRAHRAVLDDYANMSRAALALHEATGDASYLAAARGWVAVADRHYGDDAAGGYFFTADDAEALLVRTKQAYDSPNPSGNGAIAEVLARLYHLTGEAHYRDRATAVLATFAGEAQRNVFGLATLLNAAELLERALQIVVIGRRGAADTAALLRVIADAPLPTKVLSVIDDGAALPPAHPASGKGAIGGNATVYICTGQVCSAPVTDAAALAAALRRR
ncbi:MAG TPA: thioredoxin domain-containing protein [Stellaceae bacterium]|nr:thioredoxin domain-containing protein [Stellaceae bacterium]